MVDKSGIIEKVTSGRKLDGTDALVALDTAAGFLPGYGQIAQCAVTPFSQAAVQERNLLWIQDKFGNLAEVAMNPAYRRECNAVGAQIGKSVAVGAAGTVGGIAGGALGLKAGAAIGTAIMPGPGTLVGGAIGMAGGAVGAIGGSMLTTMPVSALLDEPRTEAFDIVHSIVDDKKAGRLDFDMLKRKTFIGLAASLPDQQWKAVEELVRKMSNGSARTLQEALEKQPKIIDRLMNDPYVDDTIRAYNGLLPSSNPTGAPDAERITATELFAEKIAAGMSSPDSRWVVDPHILLLNNKRIELASYINNEIYQQYYANQGVDVTTATPFPDGGPASPAGGKITR
ncbi:MAG: hypothetical protein SFW63_08145 [Alphaproteobacteria bacterium]|nr:hypothetical protein [Alphaproteobacteria bacterium]